MVSGSLGSRPSSERRPPLLGSKSSWARDGANSDGAMVGDVAKVIFFLAEMSSERLVPKEKVEAKIKVKRDEKVEIVMVMMRKAVFFFDPFGAED